MGIAEKNETPIVEEIPLKDEYGGDPIPKHNLTRVLDVLDPSWRKPKKSVIKETVFPGNKDEIADVLKHTTPLPFVTDELPTSNKKLDDYELEELLDILDNDDF